MKLPRSFYRRDPVTVARALLGQRLVRVIQGKRLSGLIVETEAYLGVKDRASHSFAGRKTARNRSMYGEGGTAYVFLNYGIHHLLNVVTETPGQPSAVLIRAIEPNEGIDFIKLNRPKAHRTIDLCSGPGRVGAALKIDLTFDGLDLLASNQLFIEQTRQRTLPSRMIATSARIGVDYAGAWADRPLRFFLQDNPHVSRRKK